LRRQRSETKDTARPVLRRDVSAAALVSLLRSALDAMDIGRIRRNDHSMAVRRFEEYLAARGDDHVQVDETLVSDFLDWLVGEDEPSRRYHGKAASSIRTLVNALPEDVRRRRLLTAREHRRLGRFGDLHPDTRKLLERFLRDGRKTRLVAGSLDATSDLLSPSVRRQAVYCAARFLRVAGVDDMRKATCDHVESYLDSYGEDGRSTAVHGLSDARPLFNYLLALGILQDDPLASLGPKPKRADDDYVPADQINKLADLSTLDPSCFRDVRDRLIAFALCYDYALRIGEVARLKLSDIHMSDFVEVMLRGEVQKGQGKPGRTLRNLFPETRTLFETYLELREGVGGTSDALLLSESGDPLLVTGARNAVKRVSRQLGIRTHGGRVPSPHRFRHSLGTLNVGELGMKLSPYYLMRRYRHNDIRTTMQVYVANNPLLDEAQHIAIVRANGNGAGQDSPERRGAMPRDITVPEAEAIVKVRSLGITWRSLRDHAVEKRSAVERDGKLHYSASFLDGLATNWMTRDEATRLMGLTSASGFRYRVKSEGIRTLVVGRASLVRVEDVMRSMRNGGDGK